MSGTHVAAARLVPFVVESNEPVAEGVFAMRLASEVAGMLAPGQFMELSVPGDPSQLLRVPLSFSRADDGRVWVAYAVVGDGTRRLSLMRPGDESTLVGPCGRGWRLPAAAGRALVVAGGIGIPPVVAAARMLVEAGVPTDAVVGARSASALVGPLVDELRGICGEVVVATDDGSAGRAGLVTAPVGELLGEGGHDVVCACGPNVMMGAVARLAAAAGVRCQVSLERMMGCGFGACSCCNVELADGRQASCCLDGPVFDGAEVAW